MKLKMEITTIKEVRGRYNVYVNDKIVQSGVDRQRVTQFVSDLLIVFEVLKDK